MNEQRTTEESIERAVDQMRASFTNQYDAAELEARLRLFESHLRAGRQERAKRAMLKPICGAKRRHGAGPCLAAPKYGKRCARHCGGKFHRGPKTVEGIERCRQAAIAQRARQRAQHVFDD
jgi:hypothetical protein